MSNITHLRPPVSETEAKELTLDSYVMHIHTQICTNCDCAERFCELFEVWTHPTKTRTTALNVLHHADRIDHSLMISYIELPKRPIPICSDCVEQYEIRDAERPTPAVSREAWAATLKRKYAPAPSVQKTKPHTPTLDDL
jgi:hypothetical protein